MLISQKTLLISSFSPKIVKSRIFQLQKKTGWNNNLMVVWLSFFFFDRGAGMKSTRVLGRHKEQWPPTTDRRQSHTASRGDSQKSCLFETFNIFFLTCKVTGDAKCPRSRFGRRKTSRPRGFRVQGTWCGGVRGFPPEKSTISRVIHKKQKHYKNSIFFCVVLFFVSKLKHFSLTSYHVSVLKKSYPFNSYKIVHTFKVLKLSGH